MTETTTDRDDLFESEPIIDIFGDSGATRVLVVLNDAAGGPLSVRDIADQANIERQTVYDNLPRLVEYGLVEEADQVGNATRYRVPMDSDVIQAFMEFRDALIDAT